MPAERLSMLQVREVLRLKHVAGHSERRIAAAIGISRYTVAEYLRRATVVGITWPVPAELDDSCSGGAAVQPAVRYPGEPEAATGLAAAACRAAPSRRHLAGAVGGVSSRATGGIWLQPFLRPLPGLAGRYFADDAPDPCRRRTAVRRLRRPDGADHRSRHRHGTAGTDLRHGAWRVELHLRRSALDAGAGGLDRLPRQCVGFLRWRQRARSSAITCPGT